MPSAGCTPVKSAQIGSETRQPAGLFRSIVRHPVAATASRVCAGPKATPDKAAWEDVRWTSVEHGEADTGTGDVFAPWRPQRVKVDGAAEHPAALVESAAMASVLPPLPTYVPR